VLLPVAKMRGQPITGTDDDQSSAIVEALQLNVG
jgi:hypothetical protein